MAFPEAFNKNRWIEYLYEMKKRSVACCYAPRLQFFQKWISNQNPYSTATVTERSKPVCATPMKRGGVLLSRVSGITSIDDGLPDPPCFWCSASKFIQQ